MKRFFFLLFVGLLFGCSSNKITDSKCFVMAQDFVKKRFSYPNEADFHYDYIFEVESEQNYIVLGKVTAKNAFGVKSDYVYKIWLSYLGGEWTSTTSWSSKKLIIENTVTREQFVY